MCSDGEELEQLVFDTKIGKLVRPMRFNARTLSKPKLEEGQSEEEDGYQASIADEKVPSELRRSSSETSAELRVRQKLLRLRDVSRQEIQSHQRRECQG